MSLSSLPTTSQRQIPQGQASGNVQERVLQNGTSWVEQKDESDDSSHPLDDYFKQEEAIIDKVEHDPNVGDGITISSRSLAREISLLPSTDIEEQPPFVKSLHDSRILHPSRSRSRSVSVTGTIGAINIGSAGGMASTPNSASTSSTSVMTNAVAKLPSASTSDSVSASTSASSSANHAGASTAAASDFAERFKYLICSSGLLERGYVPGLGGAINGSSFSPINPTFPKRDDDLHITAISDDFSQSSNTTSQSIHSSTEAVSLNGGGSFALNGVLKLGVRRCRDVVNDRPDIAGAGLVLVLALGAAITLAPVVLLFLLLLGASVAGVIHTSILLRSNQIKSTPTITPSDLRADSISIPIPISQPIPPPSSSLLTTPPSPQTLALNSLSSFLSASRHLDAVTDASLALLAPHPDTTDSNHPLRVALHRLTEATNDHIASATSVMLSVADKKEIAVLGEMYDIPVVGSFFYTRRPKKVFDDEDDREEEGIGIERFTQRNEGVDDDQAATRPFLSEDLLATLKFNPKSCISPSFSHRASSALLSSINSETTSLPHTPTSHRFTAHSVPRRIHSNLDGQAQSSPDHTHHLSLVSQSSPSMTFDQPDDRFTKVPPRTLRLSKRASWTSTDWCLPVSAGSVSGPVSVVADASGRESIGRRARSGSGVGRGKGHHSPLGLGTGSTNANITGSSSSLKSSPILGHTTSVTGVKSFPQARERRITETDENAAAAAEEEEDDEEKGFFTFDQLDPDESVLSTESILSTTESTSTSSADSSSNSFPKSLSDQFSPTLKLQIRKDDEGGSGVKNQIGSTTTFISVDPKTNLALNNDSSMSLVSVPKATGLKPLLTPQSHQRHQSQLTKHRNQYQVQTSFDSYRLPMEFSRNVEATLSPRVSSTHTTFPPLPRPRPASVTGNINLRQNLFDTLSNLGPNEMSSTTPTTNINIVNGSPIHLARSPTSLSTSTTNGVTAINSNNVGGTSTKRRSLLGMPYYAPDQPEPISTLNTTNVATKTNAELGNSLPDYKGEAFNLARTRSLPISNLQHLRSQSATGFRISPSLLPTTARSGQSTPDLVLPRSTAHPLSTETFDLGVEMSAASKSVSPLQGQGIGLGLPFSPRLRGKESGWSVSTTLNQDNGQRIRSRRAPSISPLTLAGLKASYLGLHLKRRRLACCLLGLRFNDIDSVSDPTTSQSNTKSDNIQFTTSSTFSNEVLANELPAYWIKVANTLDTLANALKDEAEKLDLVRVEVEKEFIASKILNELATNVDSLVSMTPTSQQRDENLRKGIRKQYSSFGGLSIGEKFQRSMNFAPRDSPRAKLIDHLITIQETLARTWVITNDVRRSIESDQVGLWVDPNEKEDSEVLGRNRIQWSELSTQWAGLREHIGSLLRDYERGKEAIALASAEEESLAKSMGQGEVDVGREEEGEGEGREEGKERERDRAGEMDWTMIPDFIKDWTRDEDELDQRFRNGQSTFISAEMMSNEDEEWDKDQSASPLNEVLPPPGKDQIFEVGVQEETEPYRLGKRERFGNVLKEMNRVERLELVKKARKVGLGVYELLEQMNDDGHGDGVGIHTREEKEKEKERVEVEGEVVLELKGMIEMIRQRKEGGTRDEGGGGGSGQSQITKTMLPRQQQRQQQQQQQPQSRSVSTNVPSTNSRAQPQSSFASDSAALSTSTITLPPSAPNPVIENINVDIRKSFVFPIPIQRQFDDDIVDD